MSEHVIPTYKVVILGSTTSNKDRIIENAMRHLQAVHLHSSAECEAYSVILCLNRGNKWETLLERVYVLLNVYIMNTKSQILSSPVYMGAHASILYVPESVEKSEMELGHARMSVDALSRVCRNEPLYLVGPMEDVLGTRGDWVDLVRDRVRGHIIGFQDDMVSDPDNTCLPLVAVAKTLLGDNHLWFDHTKPVGVLTPNDMYRIRETYKSSDGSVKTRYALHLS